MSPARVFLLIASFVNLVIASIISHKLINEYIIYICVCVYIFVSEIIQILNLDSKLAKIIETSSKLVFLLGYFIILTNVFVMRYKFKHCDHCVIADSGWIIAAAFYLAYFTIFMLISFVII